MPCVGGGDNVANLYQLEPRGGVVRELCHDQDHNWNPVVMNDGRVMYARWEYSDTPHYFSRLLFAMNPDGTGQMALYGSNSFWPNSIFGPRPIPGEPARVVAVVSGHHGVARMGELVLFDLAMGRHEAGGVVQRIPGRGCAVDRWSPTSWCRRVGRASSTRTRWMATTSSFRASGARRAVGDLAGRRVRQHGTGAGR